MTQRPAPGAGFTLVELLVVVLVLGVLVAIAVPVLVGQRTRALDTTVQADLRSVAIAVRAASDGSGGLDEDRLDDVVVSPGNVVEVVPDGDAWCVRGRHDGVVGTQRWVLDDAGLAVDDTRCTGAADLVFP